MAISDTTPEHIVQSDLLQNKTESAVGLKIACRILQQWGASAVHIEQILNLPYDLCQEAIEMAEISLQPEQLHRIALVLDIHASLRSLFMNPDNVKGFMRMQNDNAFFAGQTPLDLLASGDMDELIRLQEHLSGLLIN